MDKATFEMSFRKNPFNGEYTVFAGLEECLRLVSAFRFSPQGTHSHFRTEFVLNHICISIDIEFLRKTMPGDVDAAFFEYLSSLVRSRVAL